MARVLSRIYTWNTGSHHGNSVTRSSVPSLKLARSMVRTKANLALVLPCFISKFEVGGNLAVRRPPGWFRLWQIIFCDSTLWCAGVSPTIPSHPFGHPGEWGLSYPVSLALRQGRTVKTFFLFLLPPSIQAHHLQQPDTLMFAFGGITGFNALYLLMRYI